MMHSGGAMLGAELIALPALFTVLLAALLSPIALWLYRRRVSACMAADAGAGSSWPRDNLDTASPPTQAPTVTWTSLRLAQKVLSVGVLSPLLTTAKGALRRTATTYAIAGLANAAFLTLLFYLAFSGSASGSALEAAFAVFALPVLAIALYLLVSSIAVRIGLFATALIAIYVLLGSARGLAGTLFELFVLLPTALFLLFSLRFWRGVAPLVLLVSACASLLWVIGAEGAKVCCGGESIALWVGRLGGFALGAWAGYHALRWLQRSYEAKRFSDQELFLDAWWLLYTLVQTVILVLMKGPLFLVGILGFPIYLGTRRLLLRMMVRGRERRPPIRLLLLRVFGFDKRTERLFDRLEKHWRFIGTIEMIAGADLALRNIGPVEFVDFLSASLQRRFVRDEIDFENRVRTMDDATDPDGRFRVHHFWCHANTWRPVMRALATRSDVVLMDLRGFVREREGCCYELRQLAASDTAKPVVLIVNNDTELASIRELVQATEAPDAFWRIANIAKAGQDLTTQLFEAMTAVVKREGGH